MNKCSIAYEQGWECQNCCFFCEKKETCPDVCDKLVENCGFIMKEKEETELQVMESAVPDVLQAITSITVQKKKLEEQEKLMKEKLIEAMEQYNVKKFENDSVKFVYVEPTTRTSVDSTKLKKEQPEIYEKYSKTSNVSASVRITVK